MESRVHKMEYFSDPTSYQSVYNDYLKTREFIQFSKVGRVEKYTFNVMFHNPCGPAFITYYKNGKVENESYMLKDKVYRSIQYYACGQMHSDQKFENYKCVDAKYYNKVYENGMIYDPSVSKYYLSL